MGIQIETGVHAGKAGGSNQAEQLVLGEAAAGAGGFRARRAGTGRRSLWHRAAGAISRLRIGPYRLLTVSSSHHLHPPRFPENGLFSSGNMVPH